ncbi:hypothetical protein BY996DRAFT_2654553 [Phakopsora pachyrhizi]|nr:hypothetical protein BY996DRAFT_2654553 [Phakopsora pachyrhizi]
MEDYLDKRIGKIAESESDWMLASQRYWNILKGRIESSCTGTVFERTIGEGDYGLDDELHLSLLKGKIESSTLTSSLDHSCIQLVDVERCKIRIPEQQNYFDSLLVERVEVWDQLKDRYVGKGLGRSPDGNIAVVDEYIFLDMVFKNPLSAEICVKGVKIYLKSLTEEEQDLCEGKVEVEGAEDLNLSPLECRKVSLKLLSKVPDIKFEIVRVSYNFDSIFDCSQDMRKKGKRLQKTLVERRGMFYSRDKSMEFAVTGARPMVELSLVEDLVSEVYAGESVMGEIEVKNIGKVRLERLSCAFSHDSFFWICDDQGPEKGVDVLF